MDGDKEAKTARTFFIYICITLDFPSYSINSLIDGLNFFDIQAVFFVLSSDLSYSFISGIKKEKCY